MNKIMIIKIFSLACLLAIFFLASGDGAPALAQTSVSDAIAIRIIPNPEHYSPGMWYQKQGFAGDLEYLTVDGYEAVRQGQTVYVNVANVVGSNVYTNIYLISYTEESTPETSRIFDEILDHWRFNTNMTETGTCFDQENSDEVCLADSDCSGGGLCSSEKAVITRDIKRLGHIVNMREAVNSYKQTNGFFPKLESGTYLPGRTVSVWPSWKREFASALGMDLPTDPINDLGVCDVSDPDRYNEETCWDDQAKEFADSDLSDGLDLPDRSSAYIYEVKDSGQSYNLCAYMESSKVAGLAGDSGSCGQSIRGNSAPRIESGTLLGFANSAFAGYVSASDPEGDPVILTIGGLDESQFSWKQIQGENKVEITSNSPRGGTYSFTVTAVDAYGDTKSEDYQINIESDEFIIYPVADQNIIVGREFGFTVYANHSQGRYDGISFYFVGDSNPFGCDSEGVIGDGRYKCEVKAVINEPFTYNISVYAENSAGEMSTTQNFEVKTYNDPPVIAEPLNCGNMIRVSSGADIKYLPDCRINATDPNGHPITSWTLEGAPAEMGIRTENGQGVLYGYSTIAQDFDINIRALDGFGAVSEPAIFSLSVNDYCGDGVKQTPNREGRGGPGDDGYEDCDGEDGVPTPQESSFSRQYGCSEDCVTLDAGYCGDELVQDGEYANFLSTDGVEEVTLGDGQSVIQVKHDKKDDYGEDCDDGNSLDGDGCNTTSNNCQFTCGDGRVTEGEECDFGADKNCCTGCSWTTDTVQVPGLEVGGSPADESLSSGESMTLSVPDCRGIISGSFDATPRPYGEGAPEEMGSAIVFITDISGSMFDQQEDEDGNVIGTYEITRTTLKKSIERLYNEAQEKNANIHVGSFATADNRTIREIPIGNLLDKYGGFDQQNKLLNSVSSYQCLNDPGWDRPNFAASYKRAREMLSAYPDAATEEKYIIILTDGYPPYSGHEATVAKDSYGIKIYTIAFHFWDLNWADTTNNTATARCLRSLCEASSDPYDPNICYSGDTYAIRKESESTDPTVVLTELSSMYDGIIAQILSRTPTNITYTVGGQTQQLNSFEDVPFTVNNVNCDISGQNPCSPSVFDFTSTFSGSGDVRFNNFKLNILPLCD
ncbi:VWA domain-containing protein [Candidatus Falkowbacteria bacterium]|nr:VWA domain-containing protein [Candidatus Falkowbacteria bacterium]